MMAPNNSFKQILCMLVLIASLQFVAYSFMLSGTFKVLDDQTCIVNNADIKSFRNIEKIFGSSFFIGDAYYRPIVSLSYMLEYWAFDLNPFFYNLDNLLIHIATTIIVFFLIHMMLGEISISFFVALLFGIHPVHWEAVSNMSGRAILLCAFFTLSAFLFFLLAWKKREPPQRETGNFSQKEEIASPKKQARNDIQLAEPKGAVGGYFFYWLSLLFFLFGLLSKESAMILPVVICAYLACEWMGGRAQGKKIISVVPFFFLTGVYLFVRHHLGITHLFYWRSFPEAVLGFLSFARGLMTFFRVLIFPLDLHFDRMRYVFTSFFDPQLIGAVLFFIALLAALFRFRKQIPKAAWFFILWFFLELSPVSQLLVSIGVCPGYISLAEHFLYLPSIGFIAVAVILGRELWGFLKKKSLGSKPLWAIVLAGYVGFLFLTTIQQNIYAASEPAMLRQALEYDPQNNRVRNVLALYYAQNRRFDLAEKEFRASLKNDVMDKTARIGLGKALTDQGKFWEGIIEYERIPAYIREDRLLRRNIDLTYGLLIKSYQQMLDRDPNNAQARYSLGIMYSKRHQPEKAIEQFFQAVTLNANDPNALFNLASSLESVGKTGEAIEFYRKYLLVATPNDAAQSRLIPYAQEHLKILEGQGHETIP